MEPFFVPDDEECSLIPFHSFETVQDISIFEFFLSLDEDISKSVSFFFLLQFVTLFTLVENDSGKFCPESLFCSINLFGQKGRCSKSSRSFLSFLNRRSKLKKSTWPSIRDWSESTVFILSHSWLNLETDKERKQKMHRRLVRMIRSSRNDFFS